MDRRNFLAFMRNGFLAFSAGGIMGTLLKGAVEKTAVVTLNGRLPKLYAMGIQVEECIGCGRCVIACKTENQVPREPFFFRTWVERYIIRRDHSTVVQSNEGGAGELSQTIKEKDVLRSFFVPKLCNHCENPPCAQVCPVGATFKTEDGIVLIDNKRCIGCSYCIQACPYGARYMHQETHTADKCTLCYHRIKKERLPACVEVCPTQARVFGDMNSQASLLTRLKRLRKIHVLKPALNTEPKVFYTGLDGEVN
jgi:Fe-S-cluster-containing dehydrogenase component